MIGEDIRAHVFRDTKDFYVHVPPNLVSRQLVAFAKRHAGKEVLDLGCATGNYCSCLSRAGYNVKGADVNPDYVRIAQQRGVDAYVIEGRVPFPDRSFDTVLVFEVLEHLSEPEQVIKEAKRLARKNVLFTTPNSGKVEELQRNGLLFEHFGDLDHKNFFTEETLVQLLRPHFTRVTVSRGDGISPFAVFPSRALRFAGRALTRMRILPPSFHFRLYATAEV